MPTPSTTSRPVLIYLPPALSTEAQRRAEIAGMTCPALILSELSKRWKIKSERAPGTRGRPRKPPAQDPHDA